MQGNITAAVTAAVAVTQQCIATTGSVIQHRQTCSAMNFKPLSMPSSKVSPSMGLKGFQVLSLPGNGPMVKPTTHASLRCYIEDNARVMDMGYELWSSQPARPMNAFLLLMLAMTLSHDNEQNPTGIAMQCNSDLHALLAHIAGHASKLFPWIPTLQLRLYIP